MTGEGKESLRPGTGENPSLAPLTQGSQTATPTLAAAGMPEPSSSLAAESTPAQDFPELQPPPRTRLPVQLGVGLLVLLAAVQGVRLQGLGRVLAVAAVEHTDVLAGALALQALAALLNALKWLCLLRAAGLRLPAAEVLRAYFVGYFLNNLFTGLGEVERIRSLGRASGQTATVLVTVALERWCGVAVLASLSLLGTSLAAWQISNLRGLAVLQALALAGLVGLLLAALREPSPPTLGSPSADPLPTLAASPLQRPSPRSAPSLWERWQSSVAQARATLATLRSTRSWLPASLGLSLGAGLLGIGTHALLALALEPHPSHWTFLLTTPLAGALGQAPVTFNGLGIQEAAYRALFTASGLSAESALALSVLAHGCKLGVGLGGGLCSLLGRSTHSGQGTSASSL